MKSLVLWWLRWRMRRVLTALVDAAQAMDQAIFCYDMEACDVVEAHIRKLRRKAVRLAAAITFINRRKP